MKLYFSPGACSLAPHVAIQEAALKYEPVQVNLQTKQTKDGADFTKVNPKGYVPTLVLPDGQMLTEVSAILQFVADQAPDRHLAPPPASFERYRLQEWLSFIATELHKQYSPLFRPATPDDYKAAQRTKIAERLAYVARDLGAKKYLSGDTFTVADAYLYTILRWSKSLGVDVPPDLVAFMERVKARPSVVAALEAEGFKKK